MNSNENERNRKIKEKTSECIWSLVMVLRQQIEKNHLNEKETWNEDNII